MKSLVIAASAAALAMAAPALAQAQDTGWYGSVGYANVDIDPVNLGALQGRLGYRMHPNFGVEGELGFGVGDDSVNVAGANVDVELNTQAAVYAVGYLPVSDNIDLFARAGWGVADVEAAAAGTSFSGSDDGFAWGVGGQAFLTDKDGVRLDWTRHDFDQGGEADVWAIAYTRKF